MRARILLLTFAACTTHAPEHWVAPPPPPPVATTQQPTAATGGVSLDVDVDVEGKVKAEGFPAVSSDGHVAVAIQELGDGMRGFPNVVMRIFDATKGGGPTQTLPIVDVSDTADRPEDAGENFLLGRVRARLGPVRAVLRDKRWITLSATGLGVTLDAAQKLRVEDQKSHRVLVSREVGDIEMGGCMFEPYEPGVLADPARRYVLVKVSYRSPPDWCNMDDDLQLVVVR